MRGVMRNWWAIPAAIMALLLAAIFRPELRSLFSRSVSATPPVDPAVPATDTASSPVVSRSSSRLAASAAPTGAPTAVPKASPTPPPKAQRPTRVDGKDADTWREVLRGAVMRHDARIAADAFVALVSIDPARLRDRKTLRDATTAAHLAASTTDEIGDTVFVVLAGDTIAHHACDILYRLTSVHGGSRGAKRATLLLKDEAVLARGTPAMRIALAVRDAPCKSRPVLFENAAKDGDRRTLYLLQTMRSSYCGQISCCMKTDPSLAETIGAIQTRMTTVP